MTQYRNNKKMSRRNFLEIAWGVSLTALFGQAGIGLLRFLKPGAEPGAFGTKVVAGNVGEFQPGTVNHVQEGRFFISRLDDGGMLALWHRCPHLGCTIPWREDEGQFHCPCHSSIFDARGEVISGPSPRPMDLFPIEIKDNQVVVDTGSPIQRGEFHPSQAVTV